MGLAGFILIEKSCCSITFFGYQCPDFVTKLTFKCTVHTTSHLCSFFILNVDRHYQSFYSDVCMSTPSLLQLSVIPRCSPDRPFLSHFSPILFLSARTSHWFVLHLIFFSQLGFARSPHNSFVPLSQLLLFSLSPPVRVR